MKNKELKRKVLKDCKKAMMSSLLLRSLTEILTLILTMYTITTLGPLADSIFELNFEYGLYNVWKLIFCLLISILVVPLIGTITEIVMFKNSLTHDRLVLSRYLDKNYVDASSFSEGEVQYRLEQDPTDLRCSWVDIMIKFISIPCTTVYFLYKSIKISLIFTIIILIISCIKLTVPVLVKKIKVRHDKEIRDYNTQVRECETEITEKLHIVKMFRLSNKLISKIDELHKKFFKKTLNKDIKCNVIANNISALLGSFCTIAILLIGTIMISCHHISPGDLAIIVGLFSVSNNIFSNIASLIKDIPIFNNVLDRMTLLYREEEVLTGDCINDVNLITAKNVSFEYEGRIIFDDINFTISKSEKVAICGLNGSGKSTFLKILCGLLTDYSGEIDLNNNNFKNVSINDWRNCFSFVEQHPYLFKGSVKENIRLGNLNATNEDVEKLMIELGIGYLCDRYVSMNKNDLSGGEKQKVAIARALLRNSPIIILDEPSVNLDAVSLKWLTEFIRNTKKTIIYISHNEELSNVADRIIQFG